MRTQRTIYLNENDLDALKKASHIMYAIADAIGEEGLNFRFSSFDVEGLTILKEHPDHKFSGADFNLCGRCELFKYAGELNDIIKMEENI